MCEEVKQVIVNDVNDIIKIIAQILPKLAFEQRRMLRAIIDQMFDNVAETPADISLAQEIKSNLVKSLATIHQLTDKENIIQMTRAGLNNCPQCNSPKVTGYYYPVENRNSQVMEFRPVCLTCEKPKPILDVPEPIFDCNELFLFMGVVRHTANATLRLWEYFVHKPDISDNTCISISFEIENNFTQFTEDEMNGLELSEIHQDLKMMRDLFGNHKNTSLLVHVKYN